MLTVEYRPLADLIPYARNSRTHSDEQVAQIAASIKEFGFTNPILVDEAGGIIAGHGRVKAAHLLGVNPVPTIKLGHLSPTQRKAYVIADNRLALNAGWDTSMLSLELAELKAEDFSLDLLGFDNDEFDKLLNTETGTEGLTDPDDVPTDVETRCKPGDLWILGSHRLLCGDSTNVQHVDRLMGGEKADMCFTSPPYADMRDYGGNDLDPKLLASFLSFGNAETFFVNLGMKRKDNAIVPWWNVYLETAEKSGLKLLAWLVWDKGEAGSYANQQAMFPIHHEWIFVFGGERVPVAKTLPCKHSGKTSAVTVREKSGETSSRGKSLIGDFKAQGSVIQMAPVKGGRKLDHPAPFPVSLPELFIESCEPRTVYEPFTGSGSTLIACEKTGRRCFGMEIDPKYCSVILARWEQFTGKTAVLAELSSHVYADGTEAHLDG